MARRIRFTLSYDGTAYHGWQVQPGLPTIQGTVEAVLAQIEGKPVQVAGSGRTDAGVHAVAQVAAVTLDNPIPAPNLLRAMNRLLPADIRITATEEVHEDFHPRFDAVGKTYEYRVFRGEICSPFERRYVWHHPFPLNEPAMIDAAAIFLGDHDFTAFAAADEKDVLGGSKVRTISRSELVRDGDLLRYRVRGSGFLKHMVRNIVGGLIEVGRGNLTAAALQALLEAGPAACKLGHAAPGRGLFLMSVDYQR